MERSFPRKKRNRITRQQKPLILLIAEGKNVTESQYFRSFQDQHANYTIKVLIPGHITDPAGMQATILRYWEQNGMDAEKGDIAFIVLDLDCDDDKGKLIGRLAAENKNARFVVSNPCFEVWFLLHFRYSTHSYLTSTDAVKDLRNHIPNYNKNSDISPLLADKLESAINNAKKLEKFYLDSGASWPSNLCNPRTDVPLIIESINHYKNMI